MRAFTLALLASLPLMGVAAHAAPREKKETALATTLEEVPKKTQKLLKVVCKTAIELDGEYYVPGITTKERGFAARAKREYSGKIWELDADFHNRRWHNKLPASPWEIREVPTWIHARTGDWYRTKGDILATAIDEAAKSQGLSGKAIAFVVTETQRTWIVATQTETGLPIRIDLLDGHEYKIGDDGALLTERKGKYSHRMSGGDSVRLLRYLEVAGDLPTMESFGAPEVEPLFAHLSEHGVKSVTRYKPGIEPSKKPEYDTRRVQSGHIVTEKKGDLKRKGQIRFVWEEHRPLRFDFRARKPKRKAS